MKLGIDSYTVRWQGWDAFHLLEYSASLGLDVVHLGRGDRGSLEESRFREVKARAAFDRSRRAPLSSDMADRVQHRAPIEASSSLDQGPVSRPWTESLDQEPWIRSVDRDKECRAE